MASACNNTGDMAGSPGSGATDLPDAELLMQVSRGSEAAFKELVNRYGRYLYGIARSLTAKNEDAEDVLQETLLGAWKSKFRGEASVKTWLVAILVRQAAMHRRSKRGFMRLASSDEPEAVPAKVFENTEHSATDAKMDVAQMLEGLSTEHREVIVLRELQQMSYEEIAAVLEIPRGTVESRLFRAREELRKRFGSLSS
jgi:RNA polymerase sigma-70 factor, ECF subfamily